MAKVQVNDDEELSRVSKYIRKNDSENKMLVGILLGALILGFTIDRIWRSNKIKGTITDLKEKESYMNQLHDTNLSKAKEELITLGKNNAPEFVIKFKEAYPDLYEKLIRVQPNLINSEVAFCAYLKLNFSTKEIARYIGVTPRAVQIRKNRIRKKLNISAGEDLYLWMDRV